MKIEFDIWGQDAVVGSVEISVNMAEANIESMVRVFNLVLIGAGFNNQVEEKKDD